MAGPEEPTEPAPQRAEPVRKPARRRGWGRRAQVPQGGGQPTTAAAAEPGKPAASPAAAAATPRAAGRRSVRVARRSSSGAKKGAPPKKGPKIPTTKEVSAGGVVYRRTDEGIEVVLASRRTRRGQLAWGLAKGGIELGETREEAAIREVREETGLTADIEADLGDTKYMYVWDDIRIRKTVHFFVMRHTGGNVEGPRRRDGGDPLVPDGPSDQASGLPW